MKKIAKGLAALAVCGALNLGLTTDALAADVELINLGDTEYQYVYRPSRRYRDEYRKDFPPPPPSPPSRYNRHRDRDRDRLAPQPPPPGWGAPPPPGWGAPPPSGRGGVPMPPQPPPPRR